MPGALTPKLGRNPRMRAGTEFMRGCCVRAAGRLTGPARPASTLAPLNHAFHRLLKKGDDLFSPNRWKSREEIVNRFPRLKMVHEGSHRYTSPVEHGRATHHVRITGNNGLLHR